MMNMKHSVLSYAAVLLLAGNSLAASLEKAFPTDQGIVFHLPLDWEPVPKEILDQYSDALHKAAPGIKTPVYDYAFQKMPTETWLSCPYILVQIKKTGRIPEAELKRYRAVKKGLDEGVKQLETHAQSLLSDIRTGETVYDASSHTLWLTMQSKVVDVGDIDAVTGLRLTEFGSVQIMGYSTHADFAQYRPIFENIISSAEMSKEIRYTPRFSDSVPRVFGIDILHVGKSALIGGLIGGIGALIMMLSRKKKKDSQPAA